MYYKRLIEKNIKEALETSGVVVIEGPKFCGKSTTSKLFSKSDYILNSREKIQLANSDPKALLNGDVPRLIDEWQLAPDLWNAARSEIDSRKKKFGQFIFTGSSTPVNKIDIYHSGAGRMVKIKMNSLSLSESRESLGILSLKDLFNNPPKTFAYTNENYGIRDTAFYLCRGGWPLSILAGKDKALKITKNYVDTLFEFENSPNQKFRNKKPKTLLTLLKSYARNVSTEARKSVLINDIVKHEDYKIDDDTFDEYKEALEDLYIIRDIDAWNPNFRSQTTIITTPTRHFVDTSIATNILHIMPDDLINDPKTFGMLFEDFVVKELSIYANTLDGEVRHYRDAKGLECDVVIHLPNGKYGLIEVKLGSQELIDKAIKNLTLLKNALKREKRTLPSFLMVVTATGTARIEQGVYIVPINLLKE